jgi:hypothetical protein
MNLNRCQVQGCTSLVPPGMTVCGDCANDLAISLLHVPLLGLALEDARVKGMRFSTSGLAAARPDESPVPFNERAADVERGLLVELTHAADTIAADREYFRPPNTFTALGRWLAAQVPWIRAQHNGGEWVRWLTSWISAADAAVDRPADRVYLGPCGGFLPAVDAREQPRCTNQLYALPNRDLVECRICGAIVDVDDRQAELLGLAHGKRLNATHMALALSGFGFDVTPNLIRTWASRGLLAPALDIAVPWAPVVARDARGRPLYVVADALSALEEMRRRRAEREAARAHVLAIARD